MNPLTTAEYHYILYRDLVSFVERSFYELNPQKRMLVGAYIEIIATKLEACRRGEIKRLIINMPPRYLKSHCVTVAFVAWCLGHDPTMRIICASYGQELAEKFARDCRNVMLSAWYEDLFPTRLSDRYAVHDFSTMARGTRMATSVNGPLTGRGANMIIIDDPLKPDDALSETRRTAVNQWFDNSLLSRLDDKTNGCIIIVMQRLHQDDLVGHVLEQGAWEVLSFPAIAEEDETHVIESPFGRRIFKRKAQEALHPEREPLDTLLSTIRPQVGEYNFAAQYQQNPTPVGGAMVKTAWLRYYTPAELPERFSRTVQSWDSANKAHELSDYTVCTVWGVSEKRFYLLHVYRERLNYPELKRKVIELSKRYSSSTILIEDKASGTQLIQELQREIYGVTPYVPPPGTDKIMRLNSQTVMFENGCVYLPSGAPWLTEYVKELTSFPGSKFDDQVDSTTQALAYLRESDSLAVWERLGSSNIINLPHFWRPYL